MLTYGDGVARRRPARSCSRFHRAHGKLATVTAVRPPARFGGLDLRRRPRRASSPRSRRSAKAGSTAASSCFEPARLRLPRRRRDAASRRDALERLAADGQLARLPARRLLAVHGHAARPAPARGALGRRARRRGRCGMSASRRSGATGRRFVTGATGLVGGWLVRRLLDARRRRRLPGARLGAAERAASRAGLLEQRARRARRRARPGAARARRSASTRSTPSSTSRRRRSSAIANRNPVSTFETNIARHLGAARGRAAAARRSSRSCVASSRQGLRRPRVAALRRGRRRSQGGIPTTSASRAPT